MGSVTVYLASPGNQMHAACLEGMPTLLSYAQCRDGKKPHWIRRYQQTFGRILIDSGAYSVLKSGVELDPAAYVDWAKGWGERVDAYAGLDDISGDWRLSLRNYEHGGFPTFHNSDPWELLADLIPMAKERGGWLGIGMVPPREGKADWLRDVLNEIPSTIHVHGWALRAYWQTHQRIDSVDSTNWWRDAEARCAKEPWLTRSQACQIVVWRYQQQRRMIRAADHQGTIPFGD